MEVGNELPLLRLEHFFRPPLLFGGDFTAAKRTLGLIEIRLSSRALGGALLVIGTRLFNRLLSARVRLKKGLLASPLGSCTHYLCLDRLNTGLGSGSLRFCLIDSGECPIDLGILKLALAAIVFDGGFCSFDRGASLLHLSFVIVIVKLNDQVSLVHRLVVGNGNFFNKASDLCAERGYVSADVCVVRDLFNPSALPSVPVPSNCEHNRRSKQHNQGRGPILPQIRAGAGRNMLGLGFRLWCSGGSRRARCHSHATSVHLSPRALSALP